MDRNEIITVDDKKDFEESSVLVVRRKTRRKKRMLLRKMVFFALVVGLCYFGYKNYNKIYAFVKESLSSFDSSENKNPSDQTTDEYNEDTSNKENDDEKIPDFQIRIPEGAYQIKTNFEIYNEIHNESNINLDFELNDNFINVRDIYKTYGNESPCVLIIHSSCLMSYSNGEYYSPDDAFYSHKNNVSDIGRIICDTLNDKNINAIHIDDIFANGAIYSSRTEYENALRKALEAYPSISYVLDVSRDVIINNDLTMNKMICHVNEENVAQIKLTVGSSTDENEDFYLKNLSFANKLAKDNPDLIYGVTLSQFELSQNIAPYALKVEVGAYSNSFVEAKLAAKELANRLCVLLGES